MSDKTLKIGILSDTHKKVGRAIKVIDMLLEQKADFLVHAGDIVRPEILDYLETLPVPYIAVLGNNDKKLKPFVSKYRLFSEPHYFDIGAVRTKLMHKPNYLTPDAELIIFGHTHKFSAECLEGTLFINPGEACARNKPISEAAIVQKIAGSWHVTHCARKISDPEWYYVSKECQ